MTSRVLAAGSAATVPHAAEHIKIVGISLVDPAPRWDDGSRLRARFDCEVRGFRLVGALLIETPRGAWIAQPPKGENSRGTRAIQIVDPGLREALVIEARAALARLTGGAQ